MKKHFLFLLLALFISPSLVSANTINLDVSLGDKLSPGSMVYMSWESEGIDPSKRLDLYLESSEKGFLYAVERNLPLNGDYNWVIPDETVAADDYRLSLSTADKGPSAVSNNSPKFSVYSNSETYSITEFSAGLSYKDSGEEGQINIEFETSRPLTKEHALSLNISCADGLEIVGESAKTKCNSWVGVDYRDVEYNLKYINNTNKESHINFVLDLYKNGTLMQRKFIGPLNIPASNKANTDLNLIVTPEKVENSAEVKIRFNDILAEYYILSAACKDSTHTTGKARPDLCVKREKIYPTGKDVILVEDFILYFDNPQNKTANTGINLIVEAYNKGNLIGEDSQYVEIYDEGESDDYDNFELKILSVEPKKLKSGDQMVIRFNDILADYYILSAACKDSISVGGKTRPDLCVKKGKIYPTGKDVLRVDGFYPTAPNNETFRIEVSGFKNGKVIGTDSMAVKIIGSSDSNNVDNDFQKDLKKWSDIKFINPKEGQKTSEKIEAGQEYTLKWENIVETEWTDVYLYKYDKKPSRDYLRNGPTNVNIGKSVLDLGTAYLGQESMIISLPSDLEPGYYYFKFGGKAAGDSSPAIEIVESTIETAESINDNNDDNYDSDNESNNVNLSQSQTLDLISNLFGKNSEAYEIISLLIKLGIIN